MFYSPGGWISVYDIPGPKITDLPILFLVVPLLYDIAIICNIMRGLKSQIAHTVYFSVFVIMTIALCLLHLNRIKAANIVWALYIIVVPISLVTSVITYLRNKKRLFTFLSASLVGVVGYVYTTDMNNIKFMPAGNENAKQSNERNTAVNQIRITTEYINLRMSPSSKTEIIGKVFEDEVYTALEIVKTEEYIWYKIRTTFGDEGYLASGERNDYVEYLQAEQ